MRKQQVVPPLAHDPGTGGNGGSGIHAVSAFDNSGSDSLDMTVSHRFQPTEAVAQLPFA